MTVQAAWLAVAWATGMAAQDAFAALALFTMMAVVSAHPLGAPGWSVTGVHASYGGQTVPALGIQAFGDASFQFTGGLYRHTHYADAISEYDGNCTGSWSFSGTKPGTGSYTTTKLTVTY